MTDRHFIRCTCALALALLAALPAPAQTFPPPGPDRLHTSNLRLIDPEFNVEKRQLAWVDAVAGDIWVAAYDPATGAFIPEDGRGTLIEAAVASKGPWGGLGFTINGPEWARGATTDYVVYTRSSSGAEPSPRNGAWGSRWRGGPAMVSVQDARGRHYVRAVNSDASTELALPGFVDTSPLSSARFADSGNVVAYQLPYNGTAQAVSFDIDRQQLTQLTFDEGAKDMSLLFTAPEFGGAPALATLVGRSSIALYAPQVAPDGSVSYTRYNSVDVPVRGATWYSLEAFSWQGHSYVLAQLQPRSTGFPTSIWLIGFDPARPLLRQLTPDGLATEARADAEFLPTAQGLKVVYSKFDTTQCTPSDPSPWLCMAGLLGLFSADTGLPPP